jgi:hypothetical protein
MSFAPREFFTDKRTIAECAREKEYSSSDDSLEIERERESSQLFYIQFLPPAAAVSCRRPREWDSFLCKLLLRNVRYSFVLEIGTTGR